MSKRKRSSDVTGDFKDIATLIIGFVVLMFILIVVAIVQTLIAYWYIALPSMIAIVYGYMYLKNRPVKPVQPEPTYKTVETHVDNGYCKIYTKEIFDPSLPKPAEHPVLSILSRII
jgi:hypothetical protein